MTTLYYYSARTNNLLLFALLPAIPLVAEFKRGVLLLNRACFCVGAGSELDERNVMRLVRRFDDFGDGVCSVAKFAGCVERSRGWQQAKERVEHLTQVMEEAEMASAEGLGVDVVNGAVQLGIRLKTDTSSLWIVYEMLDSDLPEGWKREQWDERDETGEIREGAGYTVYFEESVGRRSMNHPSAPYFRRIVNDHYLRTLHSSSNQPAAQPYPQPTYSTDNLQMLTITSSVSGSRPGSSRPSSGRPTSANNEEIEEGMEDFEIAESLEGLEGENYDDDDDGPGRPMSKPFVLTHNGAKKRQPRTRQGGGQSTGSERSQSSRPASASVTNKRTSHEKVTSNESRGGSRPASAHARFGSHGEQKHRGGNKDNEEVAKMIARGLGFGDDDDDDDNNNSNEGGEGERDGKGKQKEELWKMPRGKKIAIQKKIFASTAPTPGVVRNTSGRKKGTGKRGTTGFVAQRRGLIGKGKATRGGMITPLQNGGKKFGGGGGGDFVIF